MTFFSILIGIFAAYDSFDCMKNATAAMKGLVHFLVLGMGTGITIQSPSPYKEALGCALTAFFIFLGVFAFKRIIEKGFVNIFRIR